MFNTLSVKSKSATIRIDFRAMLLIPVRLVLALVDSYAFGLVLYFVLRLAVVNTS